MNSVALWVVWLVSLALVGNDVPARADVYRAAVAPRPAAAQDEPAAKPAANPSGGKAVKKPSAGKQNAAQKKAPAKTSSQSSKAAKKPSAGKKNAAQKKAPAKNSSQSSKAAKKPSAGKKNAAQKKVPTKSRQAGKNGSRGAASKPARAPRAGSPAELHLNAKSALLINMSTGTIYFEQNPDKSIAPASITKLLTLYLVREAMAQGRLSTSTPIPVSSQAVRTGGSSMRLKRGERVPLSELIKGISVVSANNACVAVAEYLGKGDASRFVTQMNAKARALGMTQSRFRNPNGLPAPGQLSTARDIAKLSMAYLRTFPESLAIHSMTTHTYHGATHRNANALLRTYRGVDGLKTGFVCASGYNITATAKRGGTRLLAVVLGAQSATIRRIETARLLDYGFKRAAAEQGAATLARKN